MGAVEKLNAAAFYGRRGRINFRFNTDPFLISIRSVLRRVNFLEQYDNKIEHVQFFYCKKERSI